MWNVSNTLLLNFNGISRALADMYGNRINFLHTALAKSARQTPKIVEKLTEVKAKSWEKLLRLTLGQKDFAVVQVLVVG